MFPEEPFFLESQLAQQFSGRRVLVVNKGDELSQLRLAEDLLNEEPDGFRTDPLPVMGFGDSISDFRVAHHVADVLQRNAADDLAVQLYIEAIGFLPLEIAEARPFAGKHGLELRSCLRLQGIMA